MTLTTTKTSRKTTIGTLSSGCWVIGPSARGWRLRRRWGRPGLGFRGRRRARWQVVRRQVVRRDRRLVTGRGQVVLAGIPVLVPDEGGAAARREDGQDRDPRERAGALVFGLTTGGR